jgi:DNA-binding response OmpR family regulator
LAHILIADDDELIAEILSDAFAAAGHPSHSVPSAEAAWESVHARRPDILLLDQDMPGLPGLALLGKLRASPLFHDLPVVMMTGTRTDMKDALNEDEARCAGAQDFIRKPFAPEALVFRIEKALERSAATFPLLEAWGEIADENDFPESAAYWQRYLPEPRRT